MAVGLVKQVIGITWKGLILHGFCDTDYEIATISNPYSRDFTINIPAFLQQISVSIFPTSHLLRFPGFRR